MVTTHPPRSFTAIPGLDQMLTFSKRMPAQFTQRRAAPVRMVATTWSPGFNAAGMPDLSIL